MLLGVVALMLVVAAVRGCPGAKRETGETCGAASTAAQLQVRGAGSFAGPGPGGLETRLRFGCLPAGSKLRGRVFARARRVTALRVG